MEHISQYTAPSGSKTPRALKIALVIAIVIVINLFFNVALNLFYKQPEYQNFCPQQQVTEQINSKEACLSVGGAWTDNGSAQRIAPVKTNPNFGEPVGYCDPNFTCQKNYDAANKMYDRNVFITLLILGVASIIGGFFLGTANTVALGVTFGGVLSIIIGAIRYWSNANDVLRVLLLMAALAALIWIGIKKVKE